MFCWPDSSVVRRMQCANEKGEGGDRNRLVRIDLAVGSKRDVEEDVATCKSNICTARVERYLAAVRKAEKPRAFMYS